HSETNRGPKHRCRRHQIDFPIAGASVRTAEEAMSSPIDYADRYWNLQVELDSGPVKVQVHQYHLGDPNAAKDRLWGKLRDYVQKQQKLDPSFRLMLHVNGGAYEFLNHIPLAACIVRPFTGKGSPECCQVVLQLAVRLGEATPHTLQTY